MVFGWTDDDGATNAGPAGLYPEEENMKAAILSFAHRFTDEDFSKLFSLYPASDFEQEVTNYEATKAESDPVAPVHWFRVSRMLRDILFTCSSIDFGYEMSKQSKTFDKAFQGVRLYDLNQSMLTPLFKGMGMPYIGACHGSDYNYLSNGVFPEGQVSEVDKALSESMATSFIHFAYTGDPTNPNDKRSGSWPEAFAGDSGLQGKGPSELNLQVTGGPLGTGPCRLSSKAGSARLSDQEEGSIEIPLGADGAEFGQMDSAELGKRKQELERQKLLERCAFVNSLAEKLDI